MSGGHPPPAPMVCVCGLERFYMYRLKLCGFICTDLHIILVDCLKMLVCSCSRSIRNKSSIYTVVFKLNVC